ncbi:HalOD1 output domain-containing protein [Haloarchaeobius sp. HRN-SO-5]|uniref:HalOD1 output domain-containing protein n=1 Tax=Haloarchaeobius sp. HRN-SO-5 TaxID=3446118 RepID=UPI003EB7CCDD
MTDNDSEPDDGDGSGERRVVRWREYDRPTTAVVSAVADMTGRDELELPVLADAVDTDALDAIFDHAAAHGRAPVTVSFEYAGVSVTVDSDGELVVEREA